jgi:uncharacterized protein (DUF305 family)
MGGDAMAGTMMSDEEMAELHAASGDAVDRMWLETMIRHHEGAIQMAEEHHREGQYRQVLELSEAVITAQQAEIDEMRAILG